MKNHLLILLFLLLLSCGKKTSMKGRIVNPVTNTGIAGIKVIVTKPKKVITFVQTIKTYYFENNTKSLNLKKEFI